MMKRKRTELKEEIRSLKTEMIRLEWMILNPPKFKIGDKVMEIKNASGIDEGPYTIVNIIRGVGLDGVLYPHFTREDIKLMLHNEYTVSDGVNPLCNLTEFLILQSRVHANPA